MEPDLRKIADQLRKIRESGKITDPSELFALGWAEGFISAEGERKEA